MPPRKIHVGNWELQHHILRPTRCLLQTHTERLQRAITPPLDPLITFHLTSHPPTPHSPPKDDAPRTIAIHRSLLRAAAGPLEVLVTAPFQEASQSDIVIHETYDSFDIIRRFLYCQPIKMLDLPPDLPLVADRWGLTTLFEACFTHAEERAHPHALVPKLSMPEMVINYLPIMAIVDVPHRFKTYFAIRLAVEMRSVDKHFRDHPVQPKSVDDICCVQHDQSVTCRRRRAVCAGKDQQPCTTIENPSATSASVKRVAEPGEDPTKLFGDAENTNENAEHNVEKHTEEEIEEKTGEEIEPDGPKIAKEKGEEEVDGELVSNANEEPSNGDAKGEVSEELKETAGDGAVSPDVKDPVGDDAEATVGVEETSQAKEPAADMNGEIASNPDDAATAEGEQEQEHAPPVSSQPAEEEGTATASNGAGATTNTGEEQQPNDDENEAQSDGEGTIPGSISDVSEHEDTDAASRKSLDTEKADSESEDADSWIDEDPTTSDTPLHQEWHDNFNIWEVFHNRNMLRQVAQYLALVGGSTYTPLILDVALRQLEQKLSDEEVIQLLRRVDWEWENPESGSLTSHASKAWNARAWQLLARAKSGFMDGGNDIRMNWNYDNLCQDMHARASELANRSNNGSDSESSHSSDDDDTEFVEEWGRNRGDGELKFTLSIQCDRMTLENPTNLNLRIRVVEQDDAFIDKRNGGREVALQIRYIESGCGCDLPSSANGDTDLGYIITNSGMSKTENKTTLWQLKDGGMTYKIMNGDELHEWISLHRKECGLVFHVRLYVYPLKEDDQKKKGEDDEDEDRFECTCGFCECEPCRLEEQQAGPEDEQGSQNQEEEEDD